MIRATRIHISFCVIFLSIIAQETSASAWPQKQGDGEVIAAYSYYFSDTYRDKSGAKARIPEYSKHEINPYIEYGLTGRDTLGTNIFLNKVEQNGAAKAGIGDVELFWRRQLFAVSGCTISLQPLVKLPSFSSGMPEIGSKSTDFEAKALSGCNLPWNSFFNVEGGYRHRSGEQQDQLKLDAVIGLKHGDSLWLASAYNTLAAGDYNAGNSGITQSNDYDLSKIQLSWVYRFHPQTSLQLGVYKDIRARNTGEGAGVTASIWRTF